MPTLARTIVSVRERITVLHASDQAERDIKTQQVMAADRALATGDPAIDPLAPDWDARWMDTLTASGRLETLTAMSESSITEQAGLSAHESKTWLIARAALRATRTPRRTALRLLQDVQEYIAGNGILVLQPR